MGPLVLGAGGDAGAHRTRPILPVRPRLPARYQLNGTFPAGHPESGERTGANRSARNPRTYVQGQDDRGGAALAN